MLKSELIAHKINIYLQSWSSNKSKLVVALDGYAGAGKTTIANFISKENHDVLIIHLDDFIRHWQDRKQMIESSNNKPHVFAQQWYRYDDLETLLQAYKHKINSIKIKIYDYDKNDFGPPVSFDLTKKILLIEGIFLFYPAHKISQMWDKTIYLDVVLDKADQKRISREKKKWGKAYLPEDHPDNWVKYYKEAYGIGPKGPKMK